ncbi:hypothetical protein C8F04DRAFT_1393501 [Mycena alexandri]|uniref:F-box domain-containing protein n=1 Tax=Mycena alexandri TaxID=1745969 RepID=A0AAD6T596_9AGAR|nr:hypothetical protein C8F04DRAFT_1393501 [Mycena alexandri]
MHRALMIPELLRLICLEIDGGLNFISPLGTRQLAILARTCTTISAHALDVLWAFHPTLMNLLACMPSDLWNKDKSLRRPILQSDWERPLQYMHRVRHLCCMGGSFPRKIHLSALFEIIRLSLPTPHLFPNLRYLRWTIDYPNSLSLVPLLLAPGITAITLGTFISTQDLTLLATLAARCPALMKVSIFEDTREQLDGSKAVSSFVCGLSHIQVLSLGNLDQPAFMHLANVHSLRELDLIASPRLTQITDEGPKFVALRHLAVSSTPAKAVLALICALSYSSPLQSLEIDLKPRPSALLLEQLYAALKQHLPPSLLQDVTITTESLSRPGLQIPGIPFTTIGHLLYFPNLRTITLQDDFGVDISDDALCSMARAWPGLESLSLCAAHLPQRALRPTLFSLLYLAEHCPKLMTLDLAEDASTVPLVDEQRYRKTLQHKLCSWSVAGSLSSSPLPVARFLSGLFTQLDSIINVQEGPDDPGANEPLAALWGAVGDMMAECHEMREEERLRAGGTRMRPAPVRARARGVSQELN